MSSKHIFLKLEKVNEGELKLEFSFDRDDEKNIYIMGIASTQDKNSYGYVVDNKALTDAWLECNRTGKNIAVYEKHSAPVGKMVACEELGNKILVVLEIPKAGNERLISVYEQGIYVGLSIGGWTLDGSWNEKDDVFHVTEFEWYEVSLTDIPSNENALLLEYANTKKQPKPQSSLSSVELEKTLQQVIEKIKGIK